jgi:ankyrin repeat protein
VLARLGLAEPLRALLARDPRCGEEAANEGDAPTLLFCLPDDEAAAVEIAEILLEGGADPKTRNRHGQTAAEVARERGLDDAADLIEAGQGR